MASREISHREILKELRQVVDYRPRQLSLVVLAGVLVAALEVVGVGFVFPLLSLVRADGPGGGDSGVIMDYFVRVFDAVGLPLTIETVIVSIAVIVTLRYVGNFLISWYRDVIGSNYIGGLHVEAYNRLLDAEIAYFDTHGSDEVINALITQVRTGAGVIYHLINLLETFLLLLAYTVVLLYLAPELTLIAVVLVGLVAIAVKWLLGSGFEYGDRVADANESIQNCAQAGTYGIREVKLYGIEDEKRAQFRRSIDAFVANRIRRRRNQQLIENGQLVLVFISMLAIIYLALQWFSASLGTLAVLFVAVVRLGPRVSKIASTFYNLEDTLAHQVRNRKFLEDLARAEEAKEPRRPVPDPISNIEFSGVEFSYGGEQVLHDVDLTVERGQHVAIVGQSGAGKSTIASLLARFYNVDSGTITADGVPIEEFDLSAWRERIALVRQTPYLFNETLRYNLTIGAPAATDREIEEACAIAAVDEFVTDLEAGYETVLGDDGVRLSGGQRQRVAIARALLKDGDVLLLDEATSEVDNQIQESIHARIDSLKSDLIVMSIAHQLRTVESADTIYALDDGYVVESGSHEELLERNGVYKELYSG